MSSYCYLFTSFLYTSHREEVLVKNLRKFLAEPPPATVTSLKLAGLEGLESLLPLSSPENTKVWANFVVFWYPKLMCLEVERFDNFLCPNKSFVTHLLAAPLLSRFVCSEICVEDRPDSASSEFPQRLFYIPNLKIGSVSLKNETLLRFYEGLQRIPNW